MVSVLSSVLTHSLWRVVSGDPHNKHDGKHTEPTPTPLHTLSTPHSHMVTPHPTLADPPIVPDGKILGCLAGRCVCFGSVRSGGTTEGEIPHDYQDQTNTEGDWEMIQPHQDASISSSVLTQYPIMALTSQDFNSTQYTRTEPTPLSSQYIHPSAHRNPDHEDSEEEWCLSDDDLPNISDFVHHTPTRPHLPPANPGPSYMSPEGPTKQKVSWKLTCTGDGMMSGDEGGDESSDDDVGVLTWPEWSGGWKPGVATAGSGGSSGAGVGWRRQRQQCVRNRPSDRTSHSSPRPIHSSHAAAAMEPPLPGSAPAPTTPQEQGNSGPSSGHSDSAGVVSGLVREDIRDFDIYTIRRPDGDGLYPRLPALLAHSDSDTDEDSARKTVLRRRKRRNLEDREAAKIRRTREPSMKQSDLTYPECPILAPHTTSRPPSHIPLTALPSPSLKPREDEDDPASDTTMNDDDDDDDDEASTVVPDDFNRETDSDIEVLSQSGESWVDLSNQQPGSPDRVAPLPFGNGEEYLRLLREAQRESNQSSARVSLASSRRDTPRDSPHDSPKSPPNSPNTEMATGREEVNLKGVYINYYNKEGDFVRVEKNTETDWIWDWSSRPDQTPPKEWRFSHPRRCGSRGASIRRVMVGNSSLFSRDVLYTLLITNVLSLIIGTGIGIWLSKRSGGGGVVTLPIN